MPYPSTRFRVILAAILAAACLGIGNGCQRAGPRPEKLDAKQAEAATRRQAAKRKIAELAKKHGANTSWTTLVKSEADYLDALSFQRQEAFDGLLGRPILAIVSVCDVYRAKDGDYRLICQLSTADDELLAWGSTYFALDLDKEKAKRLAQCGEDRVLEVFAVVAVPSDTEVRCHSRVTAEKSDSSGNEARLTVEEPSGQLWVRGKCLEAECVPGYW